MVSGGGGQGYGAQHHLQQYSTYIMAVSFMGGGKRSTQTKTTNLSHVTDKLYHIINVLQSTPGHEWDSDSQHQWWQKLNIANVQYYCSLSNISTIRTLSRISLHVYRNHTLVSIYISSGHFVNHGRFKFMDNRM